MKKVIPFEKLSKKKQRELNAKQRRDWGGLNPVTQRPENPKAYNRRKAQRWKAEKPPHLVWQLPIASENNFDIIEVIEGE